MHRMPKVQPQVPDGGLLRPLSQGQEPRHPAVGGGQPTAKEASLHADAREGVGGGGGGGGDSSGRGSPLQGQGGVDGGVVGDRDG